METTTINQTPEKSSAEFVHLQKPTYKTAVQYLFSQAVIHHYLNNAIGVEPSEYTDSPVCVALELMVGKSQENNLRFMDSVGNIVSHYSKFKNGLPKDHFEIRKRGKKIYKAVKIELEKYNCKSVCHE